MITAAFSNPSASSSLHVVRTACSLYTLLQKMFWSAELEPVDSSSMSPFFEGDIANAIAGIELILAQMEHVTVRDGKLFTPTEHRHIQIKYNSKILLANVTIAHNYLTKFVNGGFSDLPGLFSLSCSS